MIIYEVNLDINSNIYDEFILWLKGHIQEVLQFNGFQKANLYEEMNLESDTGIRNVTVNYDLDTFANLQEYFDLHATKMRNITIEKFGNQIKARRRVLKLKHIIEK